MAAQAALIADTIVGLKKALRRENECKNPITVLSPWLAL
jgi:hypothetical protein